MVAGGGARKASLNYFVTGKGSDSNHQPASAFYFLFLTHHLLAAFKQADLQSWTKELNLVGLAKRGYPGLVLLTARKDSKQNQYSQRLFAREQLDDVSRRIRSLR